MAAIALGVRLLNVDGNPLQPSESVLALDSWRILHHDGIQVGASPLLVYANTVLFLLLGSTDAVARSLSVFAGWLTVLSPLLLRRQLGRFGTFGASVLLAVSPTLVFASRSIDPSMLSVSLCIVIAVAILRYLEDWSTTPLVFAAVGLALLVMSGPLMVTFLIVGATFGVLWVSRYAQRFLPMTNPKSSSHHAVGISLNGSVEPSRDVLRKVGLAFGLTFLPVATALGTNLEGIGESVSAPVAAWASAFSGVAPHPAWLFPAILVGYEPWALIFGVAGAVLALRQRWFTGAFLSWWFSVGLVLLILSDGHDANWAAFVVVPLGILAGYAIEALVREYSSATPWKRLGWYAVVVMPLIATSLIALGNVTLPVPNVPTWLGAVPPLLIVAFTVGFGFQVGWRATFVAVSAVALVALLGFSVHAMTLLNPGGELNPSEYFTGSVTSPDVRHMSSDIAIILDELEIARQLQGKDVTMSVEVATPFAQPILWYLHPQSDVHAVRTVSDSPGIAIVSATDKAPNGPYAGQLFQYSVSTSWPKLDFKDLWRWWIYHESGSRHGTYVKVYVKTQLAQP